MTTKSKGKAVQVATGVAGKDTSTPPERATATGQQPRPGAPESNQNALKHGLFSRVAAAKRRRSEHHKAAEAEGDAILAELGLADSPTAQRLMRRMVQAEVESALLERYVEARGRQDKGGALKPAYGRMLDLRHSDLADARRLLEQLATFGNSDETHVIRIVEAADGAA